MSAGRDQLPEIEGRQLREHITSRVPLKRFGLPEEIASAVLYLTAPESSFIVGTELVVDRGMIQI
ncbi:MAG TPA: SDR family oxidoreductase [Candidatus Polarisedimenticolia bacterium]|nr:SDR family oxidoreductase [Candidatus Polarisedimenticolia bacterium]